MTLEPASAAPISRPLWALQLLGLGVAFWLIWMPWALLDFMVPVAAALPVLAIAISAWSRGAVTLSFDAVRKRQPNAAGFFLAPMVGLAFVLYRWVRLLYWTPAIWPWAGVAFGVAIVIVFIAARVDRTEMSDTLMLIFTGATAFAWAAAILVHINCLPPPKTIASAAGAIADKQSFHGRSGHEYDIWIRTLDGQFEEKFPVPQTVYQAVNLGERACILRKRGLLGIWWRDFDLCGEGPLSGPRK